MLTSDSFRPDKRLDEIMNALLQYNIYKHPDADAETYQGFVDDVVSALQSNGNYAEKIDALVQAV